MWLRSGPRQQGVTGAQGTSSSTGPPASTPLVGEHLVPAAIGPSGFTSQLPSPGPSSPSALPAAIGATGKHHGAEVIKTILPGNNTFIIIHAAIVMS